MAAIWGVIDKKQPIPEETISKLRMSMQDFKIDRYDEALQKNVYFACGHQYFTWEAQTDISPYYDEKAGVLFAADCVLYNREELVQLLSEACEDWECDSLKELGDAMLAYRAYACWGERFVEKLRGCFSFAIYEAEKEQLLLYTDHLAQRYLSYYCDEQAVCFATVYQPILAYLGKERIKLHKEWILAAYTDCTADTLHIPGCTVYENVYHIEPGCYVKVDVTTNTTQRITYWNPLHAKLKCPKLSDEEYKELFLATFRKTLKSMLRAKGETGISLSGGLDSATVAAFAASELSRAGKRLFSYTSVPVQNFEFHNDRFYIENEKELILEQQRMYPNIVPRFVDESQLNCFSNMKSYAELYLEPVKPVLNMLYLEGIRKAAVEDGCSIVLSGQNGNATISYGSILTYAYQKFVAGNWWKAYKEVKAFCKLRGIARKKFLKVFWGAIKEEHFSPIQFGEDCLLKEEDIKKYKLVKKTRQLRKTRGTGFMDSRKQRRGFCFMPLVFQHMGFYDTYSSLKCGVLALDPTLTKDMIELSLMLPIDCYVRNGKERRMVRDYMKGLVTEKILENHTGRGVQAADFAYRVNRDWDKVQEDIYEVLEEPMLSEFLDKNKVQALIHEVKDREYDLDKNLVAKLAVISSLAYYLKTVSGIAK